jgi:hypothetical protein
MSLRPIIIGMNNPISDVPEHALWPDPPNCAGWRLQQMSGLSKHEYLRAFERRNLLIGPWLYVRAVKAANDMRPELAGRRVVLLGAEVRRAFGFKDNAQHGTTDLFSTTWYFLPHPSGRNLWYNDPANVKVAETLLKELACTPSSPETSVRPFLRASPTS